MSITFKDDVFVGNRKYTMITNDDNTISLVDVTTYTQTGTTINAAVFNGITSDIDSAIKAKANTITLSSESWSDGVLEYTLSWVTSNDVLIVDIVPSEDEETRESELLAWSNVYSISTESGKVVFKASDEIDTDLNIAYVLGGVLNG